MTKFRYSAKENVPNTKTVLVTVALGRCGYGNAAEELTELALSDALAPVAVVAARRDKPDPATFLGAGKIEEIRALAAEKNAVILVFDVALSAAQERNIANATGCRVLDRTELILEIFDKRAKSREGRLQVELAKLEHLSTRLVRGWTHLERQRGGLSKTGGPGEKQIELDRRGIAARVKELRRQLAKLTQDRTTQRRSRARGSTFTVSLVGYTNAGKSTLFNALTKSTIYAANQLFATLDTTVRRCWIKDATVVALSDTVGFIRGLPHQLIDAFKSTLEEAVRADLLLHVVDIASDVKDEQMASVRETLEEIGARNVKTLTVFNKCDKANLAPEILRDATGSIYAVTVSALKGEGLDLLREAIAVFHEEWEKKKKEQETTETHEF